MAKKLIGIFKVCEVIGGKDLKHVVMFSGGAASSVMAKMVADKYPNSTILLHTPTGAEHPDADRFREQVADFIGLPITVEAARKTLWEYVETSWKHVPNNSLTNKCTEPMKIKPQNRFLKRLEDTGEDYIIYVGFTLDEWRRVQRTWVRNEAKGRKVEFPLFDARLTSEECKNIIRDDWGICLPEPYKYLKHNNCIPCWKGGQQHWHKVWKYYPKQFWRAVKAEEKAVNTVFNGITLAELAKKWEQEPVQPDLFGEESIPCMCAD